jgi:hypothetical protein
VLSFPCYHEQTTTIEILEEKIVNILTGAPLKQCIAPQGRIIRPYMIIVRYNGWNQQG